MWRLYIHGGVYFKITFGKNNYDKPDLQILCKTERFPVLLYFFLRWTRHCLHGWWRLPSCIEFFPIFLEKIPYSSDWMRFFLRRGQRLLVILLLSAAFYQGRRLIELMQEQNLLANLTYLFGINRLKTLKKQNADAGSPDQETTS